MYNHQLYTLTSIFLLYTAPCLAAPPHLVARVAQASYSVIPDQNPEPVETEAPPPLYSSIGNYVKRVPQEPSASMEYSYEPEYVPEYGPDYGSAGVSMKKRVPQATVFPASFETLAPVETEAPAPVVTQAPVETGVGEFRKRSDPYAPYVSDAPDDPEYVPVNEPENEPAPMSMKKRAPQATIFPASFEIPAPVETEAPAPVVTQAPVVTDDGAFKKRVPQGGDYVYASSNY